MGLFDPVPDPVSLEDLFLERHQDLLRAATAITGDRREAEDLVQDAFIRIRLTRPDPKAIDRVDAYLRAILRNMHTARMRRRAQRSELQLAIVDFDSAQFAERAMLQSDRLQARQSLHIAAEYACARRHETKTASLFILRFFHEYVPNEIAVIGRLSRDGVDQGLTRARQEVRAHLENPAAASVPGQNTLLQLTPPTARSPHASVDADFVAVLRTAIFALRHAECFSSEFLRRLYTRESRAPVATNVLAQLVTCPVCLDAVNRICRLPPMIDRHGVDSHGGDDHRSSFRWRRPSQTQLIRRTADHRIRTVRAHRARMLRIFVNGFLVGTHDITGPITRAAQVLLLSEPIRLVELFSEQDVCLAALDVAPCPDAEIDQRATTELGDGRRAELALTFLHPWPSLHILYQDPEQASVPVAPWNEAPDTDARARGETPASSTKSAGERFGLASWLGWSLAGVVVLWLVFFTPGTKVSAAERVARAIVRVVQSLRPTGRRISQVPLLVPVSRAADVELVGSLSSNAPPRRMTAPRLSLSPADLAQLEVETLLTLQDLHALAGHRLQVTRSASAVTVTGIVEGLDRLALIASLRAIRNGGRLAIALQTPDELAVSARVASPAPRRLQALTVDRDAIPAAPALREYLTAIGFIGNVEAEIRRLSNDALRRSRTALLEGLTLERLAERYQERARSEKASPSDAETAKWKLLLTRQVESVDRAVIDLRNLLEPPFGHAVRVDTDQEDALATNAPALETVARAIGGVLVDSERDVRASFAVAAVPPSGLDVSTPAFWTRLAQLETSIHALGRQIKGQ